MKKSKIICFMLALVMVICMTPGFALAQDAPALDFIEMSNTADGVGNSLQIAAEPEDDYDYKLYIPDFQESVLSNATYAKAKAVDPNQKVWVCTTASLGGFGIVAAKMQEISADDWTSFKCSSRTDKTIQIYVGSDAPTIKKEGKIQSFDFPESGTAYNVKITLVPTLNGLSIQNNNTLTPDYTWENKEYTAYVSDTLTSVTFNSVKFSTTQSITYNDKAEAEVPLVWNSDGKMQVDVKVSNEMASSTYTVTLVKVTLSATPQFIIQPKDAVYIDTASGKEIKDLKVNAIATDTVSYQWYRNTDNSNQGGTAIEGATSSSYTPVISDIGKTQEKIDYYYCIATNTTTDGQTITSASNPAAVTIHPDPIPENVKLIPVGMGSIPQDGYTYLKDAVSTPITVTAECDAEGGEWTYQWERASSPDSIFLSVTEVESAAASFSPTTRGDLKGVWYYRCRLTHNVDGVERFSYSDIVKVTVDIKGAEDPIIGSQPKSAQYTRGTTDIAPLLCIPKNYMGYTRIHQWQESTDGETFTDIENSDSFQYTPEEPADGATKYYRCRVQFKATSIDGTEYLSANVYSNVAEISWEEPGFNLEGEGTQDHPYLVKSAEDMVNLQQAVNEWNLNFDGQYVKMAANITLPDDWTPIGTDKKTPFKGTFDGGNFLLTVPEGGKPLFGVVSGDSVLRNLDIQGKRIEGCGVINEYIVDVSSITIENVTLKSGTQTLKSGFIGDYGNLPVTIRNCTVEKGVVIGYDKQQSHIGSFGGEINGYFENCVSHATVYGVDYVGGINANKGQTMRPYEIRNCIFDGEVVASGSYAGGISGGGYAGTNWGLDTSPNSPWPVIQNCISAGKITGQDCVGGILGGEPGVVQCWDNGIGYIQNNLFTGTVQATGENARIGGIAGYVHGLDKYVEINNNYFAADCGAGLGIGFVKYVDTNNENVSQGGVDKATETYYFDTSDGGKGAAYPKGATRINQNRTDDPLGADVEQLTKAVTEEQLKDGTVTQWLNEGPNSLKNWIQGETSPVFSNEAVLLGLTLSGEFKTSYVMGEEFSTENMVITATYSDGSSKVLNPDDVAFKGFNGMTKGTQTITVSYDVAKTEYTVTVTPSEEDQKAADSVIDLIDAIGKVTKDSGDAIAAARDAYDKANDVQKSLIINYKKLEAAEAKYAELTKDIKVPFGDVKKTQWFYSDVAYVYDKGVMTGMTDTQFGPNEDLTRGQFVTILGRYAGVKDSSKGSPADKTFNDVKETSYYASHVKWAVEQKITNGVSETKFAPEEKITREQMAAMMYRYAEAMKVALPEGDGSKFSDDGKISSYAKDAVYSMKAAGILGGMGNNTFAPKDNATRAQAAKVIHVFMEYEPAATVVISMEKFTLGQGYVLEPTVVTVEEGDTAADVLRVAAKKAGIELRVDTSGPYGFYLQAVKDNDQSEAKIPQYILDEIAKEPNNQLEGRGEANWLGEFDYYNQSGWMFCLNNEFPNVGASNVTVKDGDVMRWQFTVCGLGRDIGSSGVGGTGEAYIKVANKDALTTAVAKAKDKDSEAYKAAVEVLKKLDATQDEVDAACKAL